MLFEKKNKIINNHNYEVTPYAAMYNTSLFLKFSSMVGAGLPELFETSTNNLASLGKAINQVLTSLYVNDPKCMMMLEILQNTKRDGKDINTVTFDEFYTGNIQEMTEALLFSIEVHFKDFLPLKNLSGLLTKTEQVAVSAEI